MVNVLSVSDAGMVCGFYVLDTKIQKLEMPVETFKTLVSTRPVAAEDLPVDLSSTPLLLDLLKNVKAKPGSPYLREGTAKSGGTKTVCAASYLLKRSTV